MLWRQQTADYMREAELAISVFNTLNDTHREHPLGDLLGTRVVDDETLTNSTRVESNSGHSTRDGNITR